MIYQLLLWPALPQGYFIVGSWSNWREPEEMVWGSDAPESLQVQDATSALVGCWILLNDIMWK